MSKHAYLIMAHSDIALLKVLIAMLDYEKNDIYLHVDKKWKDFSATSLSVSQSNLYILDKRIDGAWGHSSLVDIELLLFETALNGGDYAYFHLLSGVDLPIKTQPYIHQFFEEHQGKEFISIWLRESAIADAKYKVERYHYGMRFEKYPLPRLLSILVAKARRMLSDFLYAFRGARVYPWHIVKGANWLSVSSDCLGNIASNKLLFQRYFKHTRNADEIFVQSLVYSTPELKEKVYSWESNDNAALRETHWEVGANSPKTFTIEDKERLFNSPNLFARKFSSSVDMSIIQEIEKAFGNSKS